jgi:hypothetical protein
VALSTQHDCFLRRSLSFCVNIYLHHASERIHQTRYWWRTPLPHSLLVKDELIESILSQKSAQEVLMKSTSVHLFTKIDQESKDLLGVVMRGSGPWDQVNSCVLGSYLMDQFSEFPVEPSRILKEGRMADVIIPGSGCRWTGLEDVFGHSRQNNVLLSPMRHQQRHP